MCTRFTFMFFKVQSVQTGIIYVVTDGELCHIVWTISTKSKCVVVDSNVSNMDVAETINSKRWMLPAHVQAGSTEDPRLVSPASEQTQSQSVLLFLSYGD